MASVNITNQTLTMTITIDGVDTVIRKDNCKVQAFGDVVRITDYKGSIYEFLFSDCTSPSEANANDLRDAIEEFLNTGGGGGVQDGEWTPTTSASNSATESVSTAFYQYLGGALCSFSMELEVQLGVGQTSTTITIENLPIATTFSTSRQSIISATGDFTTINSIGIQTNGNALELAVVGTVAGSTLNYSIVGSYLVL